MVSQGSKSVPREAVVLVHGLAANRFIMAPLERALASCFGKVLNWGYPSLWSRIEQHGTSLADFLRLLDCHAYERIHLVTHSMGGIVARLALGLFTPRRLARFVMITPPNRGSHIASRLAPYLGRICPPLVQLADHDASFVRSLPPPQVPELGIIAADADFLVLEPNTRLGCERDHITVPGLHSTLLWRRETFEQVRHFLEHGRFHRAA
ncbi:MAG TPA: alpha/beta fold hydrolase [Pirellulaceae bacterium]|nr:alpha/beta fold hydrolase [Pirellulaceae bacterium]